MYTHASLRVLIRPCAYWKAAEGPVNPLTPIPHQPQIIPPSPIPHTRAAARAAPAVSEPTSLTGKTQTHFDAPRVSTHTSTPEAEFSSANVSARLGPQENIVRDRKIRTGGDVDGGGGTEFFASQDESHEEDVGDQATGRRMRRSKTPGNGRRRRSTRRTRRCPPPRQAGRRGATRV